MKKSKKNLMEPDNQEGGLSFMNALKSGRKKKKKSKSFASTSNASIDINSNVSTGGGSASQQEHDGKKRKKKKRHSSATSTSKPKSTNTLMSMDSAAGIISNTSGGNVSSPSHSGKKKGKKKKNKDDFMKPQSCMTLMSTESKAKKKKSKSSRSLTGEKKKKKKGRKKDAEQTIPENQEIIQDHSHDPQPQQSEDIVSSAGEVEIATASAAVADSDLSDRKSTEPIVSGTGAASLSDDINDDDDDINDDDDMIGGPGMFDSGPPIGEILAVPTDDDNVSDIGDNVGEGPPTTEIVDGIELFYNPNDFDVCFDDRHHPGTMDWINVIRDSITQFEDQDYSPPVYKAIKKKLKGRRFLVRTRRNERTSWREATKPEIIELFGEAFNEERRRIREGITDDDSGVDSSLQNSEAQSDSSHSLSMQKIGIDTNEVLDDHGEKGALPTPTSAPTPRVSNQADHQAYDFDVPNNERYIVPSKAQNGVNRTKSESSNLSEKHLLHAMREIEDAEDYARPFNDVALLQQGIAAEKKLNLLVNLSESSKTLALKAELDKLEELAKRMKIASLAPLMDVLTKIERHVTDYYNSLAEQHASSSSLKISLDELMCGTSHDYERRPLQKTKSMDIAPSSPRRTLEEDPKSDVEDSKSHQGARNRTVHAASEHGKQEKSRSSRDRSIESSTPSISKSQSKSTMHSDFGLNHSALSLSLDDDEFGEEVTMTQPTTASTQEDGNSSEDRVEEDPRPQSPSEDASNDQNGDKNSDGSSQFSDALDGEDKVGREYERSLRDTDFGGSFKEMALGGSSGIDMSRGDSDYSEDQMSEESEFSGQLQDGPRDGAQEYENSVRTADFGGSYREMELGGASSDDEMGQRVADDEENYESGLSSGVHDGDIDIDEDIEDEGEEEDEEYEDMQDLDEGYGVGEEFEGALNVEEGHVLKLSGEGDDLSSMGRSMPGLYGSDSESDADEEGDGYEEYEIDFDDIEDDEEEESFRSDTSEELSEDELPAKGIEEKANPKLEQFFDRLQHFFEVRKKIDERVDLMDPSGKLSAMKVKLHSGGIQKKNGKFKKEYQQKNLRDKVVRNLDDLYGPAELARGELSRLLQQLIGDVKGMDAQCCMVPALKQRNKAFAKSQEEFSFRSPGPPESFLYDIVRGSVYCKSYKQVADVNKWLGKHAHIVNSKNRFEKPCFNGYRDLLFHISIPYKDDLTHICEIQVHHKDMKALDEQFGMPKHYEYFRSAFATPWRSEDNVLQDLEMLNKYGEIGGQCMVKLLKSKDPDQLRLFAKLCREKLDEFDRALELYRRILLLEESTGENDHEGVADTYLGLGLVLGALGEIDESLLNLQKALAIKESLLGTDHLEVAEAYSKIGDMLLQKGDYSGALSRYQDAMHVREEKLGKDHFLVIASLQDIGNAFREMGDFRASEAELHRALDFQESVLGASHVDVAATRSMIGITLCEVGDYSQAMDEHRQALTIRETEVGKNASLTAEAHTNIGNVLCQKGDYDVAEWRHRKALRILEAIKGKGDEACAVSLTHLGEVLKRKGDYDGAIKALKRAAKIRENNLGMDHPVSAGSHLDIGKVYVEKKKYDQALQAFRKAKVIRESFLGQRHPHTAIAYNLVGKALSLKGNHDAALIEHRRALAIYEAVLGNRHPKTATGYQFLADTLFAKGDKDDSLIEHRKALSVRASILNKDHPDTALSCSRIGDLLSQNGDLVGALVAYRQTLAITVGLCGEEHPEAATAHVRVGKVLAAQGDVENGKLEVEEALRTFEAKKGKDHPDTARIYGVMGSLSSMFGDFSEAQAFHKRSLHILEQKLGKKNASTRAARQRLISAVEKKEEDDILFAFY